MKFHKKIATLTICFASLQMTCQDETQLNLTQDQEACSHRCDKVTTVSSEDAAQLLTKLADNETSDFTLNAVKYRVQLQSQEAITPQDAETVIISCENRAEIVDLLNNCAKSLVEGDKLVVDNTAYIVETTKEVTIQHAVDTEETRTVETTTQEATEETTKEIVETTTQEEATQEQA